MGIFKNAYDLKTRIPEGEQKIPDFNHPDFPNYQNEFLKDPAKTINKVIPPNDQKMMDELPKRNNSSLIVDGDGNIIELKHTHSNHHGVTSSKLDYYDVEQDLQDIDLYEALHHIYGGAIRLNFLNYSGKTNCFIEAFQIPTMKQMIAMENLAKSFPFYEFKITLYLNDFDEPGKTGKFNNFQDVKKFIQTQSRSNLGSFTPEDIQKANLSQYPINFKQKEASMKPLKIAQYLDNSGYYRLSDFIHSVYVGEHRI